MTSNKKKGRSFWAKAEQAGEAMELGFRSFLGILFSIGFAYLGFWLGGQLWVGLAVILALVFIPLGFVIGFFWVEIKFLIRLILGSIFD